MNLLLGMSDTDDSQSLSSLNTTMTTDSGTYTDAALNNSDAESRPSSSRRSSTNGGPGFTLAALRQLGINLGHGEDIDSFIANLTIPPPPEGATVVSLDIKC